MYTEKNMTENINDESLIAAINDITETVSQHMLAEFLKLPKETRTNLVLIKSAQLLLANILCQVAEQNEELEGLIEIQGEEIKELTFTCAYTAFARKFNLNMH